MEIIQIGDKIYDLYIQEAKVKQLNRGIYSVYIRLNTDTDEVFDYKTVTNDTEFIDKVKEASLEDVEVKEELIYTYLYTNKPNFEESLTDFLTTIEAQ